MHMLRLKFLTNAKSEIKSNSLFALYLLSKSKKVEDSVDERFVCVLEGRVNLRTAPFLVRGMRRFFPQKGCIAGITDHSFKISSLK
jgi:hypothetical protein